MGNWSQSCDEDGNGDGCYDDDDEVDDDEVDDDDDDDEVDWLAWFSANAVNSPLPNSPLSAPTKIFFFSIAIIVSFDGDDSILPKEMLLHFTENKTFQ